MEILKLEGTQLTPDVDFNPIKGTYEIKGYSRPEDVREFYSPLIYYVIEIYRKIEEGIINDSVNKKSFHITFKYSYFNSASAKFISDLLFQIIKLEKIGFKITIDWYNEEYDEDMREVGADLSDMINFPFNYYTFKV